MPPPPTGYPRCRILLGRIRVYLPRLLCLFLQFSMFSYGWRTINRPLLHYLLLLYHNIFLLSTILYDFFGIISNFLLFAFRGHLVPPQGSLALQGRWLGFAVPILALSKREFLFSNYESEYFKIK